MSLPQGVAVAVFDFDHTLCRFDSSAQFFYWLMRQRWWRVLMCLLIAPLVLPLLLFRPTQKLPVRIAVRLASVGRPIDQLPALIRAYLQQARPDWSYAQGIERVRWHQHQGDQVVIATGSLQYLVEEMLRQHGIEHVLVVGSEMAPSHFGWVSAQHCIGKNKIPMLRARGISAPWQYAYSDHFADLPLLRNADVAFLVNPGAKSLRIVQAKASPAIQTLRWQ